MLNNESDYIKFKSRCLTMDNFVPWIESNFKESWL